MGIPEQRDPAVTRLRLRDWLSGRLPGATQVEVGDVGGPAATGFSNETILFEASWVAGGNRRREQLVARVQPTEYTIFLESQFEAQYRVMKALADHGEVPMAPVHWYEEDPSWLGAPFYVMGRVDGQVPSDSPPYTTEGWLHEASPEQQASVWWTGVEAMSGIHHLDWRSLGLGFLDQRHRGEPGMVQQLAYYQESLEWAAQDRPQPVAEAAFEWLKANRPAERRPPGLLWGDARIGNIIFTDFKAAAVLDWEMVTLGQPECDLGWWLFLERHMTDGIGIAPLAGFPTRAETVERYEQLMGRDMENLDYYEVWAGFRFAVVMMRIAQMLDLYGLLPEGSDLERNNVPTRLLAEMLELPPPGERIVGSY